jgi:uncharacterized membrane protein
MHPRRRHIHQHINLEARAADTVAAFVGSWSFVAIMTVLMIGWIVWNVTPVLPHFDPPQFVLLNLCLSFIAGYTGPFVMMSQNRQAEKDRKRDDVEAHEVEELFSSHELLLQINQQQLTILQLLKDQEPVNALIGRLDRHEQWQNEMLSKVSAVLEKKPRARTVKQEAPE